MAVTSKKTSYFLDIDLELRNRFKASAAMEGKSMKAWLTEAIIAKLEDEVDGAERASVLCRYRGYDVLRGLS